MRGRGKWKGEEAVVYVDGQRLSPMRAQVVSEYPGEFAWGYNGSGPELLALAILLEGGLSDEDAARWVYEFKSRLIAPLKEDAPFVLRVDVVARLASRWAFHN